MQELPKKRIACTSEADRPNRVTACGRCQIATRCQRAALRSGRRALPDLRLRLAEAANDFVGSRRVKHFVGSRFASWRIAVKLGSKSQPANVAQAQPKLELFCRCATPRPFVGSRYCPTGPASQPASQLSGPLRGPARRDSGMRWSRLRLQDDARKVCPASARLA